MAQRGFNSCFQMNSFVMTALFGNVAGHSGIDTGFWKHFKAILFIYLRLGSYQRRNCLKRYLFWKHLLFLSLMQLLSILRLVINFKVYVFFRSCVQWIPIHSDKNTRKTTFKIQWIKSFADYRTTTYLWIVYKSLE